MREKMKYETSARRIKEALNDNNVTQQELADRAGLSKGLVSQYIHGIASPSNVTAGKIADILHVSPMWLMGFDAPKYESDFVADYDEKIIIEFLRNSNEQGKQRLLEYARFLSGQAEYKKRDSSDVSTSA